MDREPESCSCPTPLLHLKELLGRMSSLGKSGGLNSGSGTELLMVTGLVEIVLHLHLLSCEARRPPENKTMFIQVTYQEIFLAVDLSIHIVERLPSQPPP